MLNGYARKRSVNGEPVYHWPWEPYNNPLPLKDMLGQLPKQDLVALILDGHGHPDRLTNKCVCEWLKESREWQSWFSVAGRKNREIEADWQWLMLRPAATLVEMIVTADCPAALQRRIPALRLCHEKREPSVDDYKHETMAAQVNGGEVA